MKSRTGALFIFVLAFGLPLAAVASSVGFSAQTSPGSSNGAHADLNNDGREDFVAPGGAGFTVQLSTGDGVYAAPVNYPLPAGAQPQLLAVADFNGDGQADVFILGTQQGSTQNTAYVYLNNGSGTFTLAGQYPTPAINSGVAGLVAGDFNHDGRMDVAWVQYPYVITWLGLGNGTFTAGPRTQIQYAGPLMMGDFDGDGHADLAVGDYTNYQNVQVLYGDGTGAFPDFRVVKLPQGYHSLSGSADVNSDGRMDLVAATFYPDNPNYISVYYGLSDRSWTANTIIPIAHCAGRTAPTAADVNGDGINDLIVAESDCKDDAETTHYIGVLTRNGNATYNVEQTVYESSSPSLTLSNVTVIRANADTKPDIAFSQCISTPCVYATDFVLKTLLNTTAGTFHSCNAPDAFVGVNVCSPSATSPTTAVPFHIGAAGQTRMRKVEVWVDGKKLGEQLNSFSRYAFFDGTFNLNPGTHQVDIYAAGWDNGLVRKSFSLAVQ